MSDTQVFSWLPIDNNAALRVGLNTGACTNSHGTFTVTAVPLRIDIVDPIGFYVTNGAVTNDPEGLATHDILRDGVASDGATEVVLRHEVVGPGQVTFQVDDIDGGPSTSESTGFFSSLGGQEQQTTLTVNAVEVAGGRHFAFAVYHAPVDFVCAPQHVSHGCRRARVLATFSPLTGYGTTITTRYVHLKRPPVVLIHGLWSDSTTWGRPSQTFITDPNINVIVADYGPTADAWFQINRRVTKDYIYKAVKTLRDQHYACTRADVIGHSMGGVLARLYCQSFRGVTYRRNENFMKGDIHKLITIDSPLKGSSMASLLVDTPIWQDVFATVLRKFNNGAVTDLDPFQQPSGIGNPLTWSNTQPTDVYVHAIVGTGGQVVIAAPGAISPTLWPDSFALAGIMKLYAMGDAFVEPSDMIVEASSQIGNIPTSTTFGYLNPENPAVHNTMNKEPRVANTVLDLLNTNMLNAGAFAPSIPARPLQGVPPNPPNINQVNGISFIFPTQGTTFSSGSTIPIIVAPINSFEPARILAFCRFDSQEIDPAGLITALYVPANAVGPLTIRASSFDKGGNLAFVDVGVQIVPSATLTGISITPTTFELDRFGPTRALNVVGHYSDDIDRDLTASALGTIYAVDDPDVASVSTDGLVTSAGFGQTTITVSNSGFNAVSQVEVVGMPCPADINYSDGVDVDDLIAVILAWGPCHACAADIDGNGAVDVDDMIAVITGWGPCPAPPSLMDAPPPPPPGGNNGCLDAIRWKQYLDVLRANIPEQVECWNCWAYWHLCVCAGECEPTPPDCPCPDPFN